MQNKWLQVVLVSEKVPPSMWSYAQQGTYFPSDFKLSLRSMKDRFSVLEEEDLYITKFAMSLFDVLQPLHVMDKRYAFELRMAAQLHSLLS